MRSLWIATGVIVVLLGLAAALRPSERPGVALAHSDDVLVPEPTGTPPHRPLGAEDVHRIVELRAEIGSAANWTGGEEIASAAFEREVRELAGLGQSPGPRSEETLGLQPDTEAEGTADRMAASPTLFRQAAAALDEVANRAEDAGDYDRADHLRGLAGEMRRLARQLAPRANETLPAAEDAGDGLIDKSQSTQAQ